MVRIDESAFWRLRRSSAANGGDMAMWEGAGVCAPVACWRRVTAATERLGGRLYEMSRTLHVMHLLLAEGISLVFKSLSCPG